LAAVLLWWLTFWQIPPLFINDQNIKHMNFRTSKLSIIALVVGLSMGLSSLQAQEAPINFFHGTWAEVLAKAKAEKKLIFMDAFTTWCGPCKKMSAQTFTNGQVGAYFNDKFINTKFDMEAGEGPQLAAQYAVKAYPTLLWIDGDGNLTHASVGYQDPGRLLANAAVAIDPVHNLSGMNKRFQGGELSADFILEYATMLADGYQSTDEVLGKYWASQTDTMWVKASNWKLIQKFETQPNSLKYVYVNKHNVKFASLYGQKEVYDYLANAQFEQLLGKMRTGAINATNYQPELEAIRKSGIPNPEQAIAQADILFYTYLDKKPAKAADAAGILIDKYGLNDPYQLNHYAWMAFENATDKPTLVKAIGWVEKALAQLSSHAFLDTKACLLMKTGDLKKAIATEEEAIKLATQYDEPSDTYKTKLAEMKKLLQTKP
jgi:thiol-disulfide isomerase/thioredoxin